MRALPNLVFASHYKTFPPPPFPSVPSPILSILYSQRKPDLNLVLCLTSIFNHNTPESAFLKIHLHFHLQRVLPSHFPIQLIEPLFCQAPNKRPSTLPLAHTNSSLGPLPVPDRHNAFLYLSSSQTFWFQKLFTVKITEDPKKLLFMWVMSIHI